MQIDPFLGCVVAVAFSLGKVAPIIWSRELLKLTQTKCMCHIYIDSVRAMQQEKLNLFNAAPVGVFSHLKHIVVFQVNNGVCSSIHCPWLAVGGVSGVAGNVFAQTSGRKTGGAEAIQRSIIGTVESHGRTDAPPIGLALKRER